MSVAEVLDRALDGERLTDDDAAELLRSRDLVAVVLMPSLWAARMIASHSSEVVFLGEMILRTRSTSTSAPPPGSESSPASRRRASASDDVRRALRATCWISDGESACRWIG